MRPSAQNRAPDYRCKKSFDFLPSFGYNQRVMFFVLRSAAVFSALGAFLFQPSLVRRDQVRAHAVSTGLLGLNVPVWTALCYARRLFHLSAHLPTQNGTSLLSHHNRVVSCIQLLSRRMSPQKPRGFLFCAARFARRRLLRSIRSQRTKQILKSPVRAAAPAAMPEINVIIKYLLISPARRLMPCRLHNKFPV
nr:MAG TPA: hypothetical protein [Caudoviricetes sp.]